MRRTAVPGTGLAAVVLLTLVADPELADGPPEAARTAGAGPARTTRVRPPLAFEENLGQADAGVRFLARAPGFAIALRADGADFALSDGRVASRVVRMRFAGASAERPLSAEEELPGRVNYLVGNDPSGWITGIRTFARVRTFRVYPGIDLVFHGGRDALEYDFVVAPGADPACIVLDFDGADSVTIDERGDLVLSACGVELRQRRPLVFQESHAGRDEVPGRFVLVSVHRVAFEVPSYDRTRPLVIDPEIAYATYFGNDGGGYAVATDDANAVYIGGVATSIPTQDPFQALPAGSADGFVAKFTADGALVFATYLGGGGFETVAAVAVGASHDPVVCGDTSSSDFPVLNAFQASKASAGAGSDGYVTKLSASGDALVWSTYLGGAGNDRAIAISLDDLGAAYVCGEGSSTFPTTPGAHRTSGAGPFVTKLVPAGNSLAYSTFLGDLPLDGAAGIDVGANREAYVTGLTVTAGFPTTPGAFQTAFLGDVDVFVTRLSADGSALVYSTLVGGTGDDEGTAIAVDAAGNAFVTGFTNSTAFPTVPPQADPADYDIFVTKVNAAGTALSYSRLFGGADTSFAFGLDVQPDGTAVVSGVSDQNDDFPVSNAFQPARGGGQDGVVVKLDPAGATLFSSYLGGEGFDSAERVAFAPDGSIWVTGQGGLEFPTTPDAFQRGIQSGGGAGGVFNSPFLAKIADAAKPAAAQSFFLPKGDVLKLNAKTPAKSVFVSSGFFDTGSDPVDLTKPATLTIGGRVVASATLASQKGGKFFLFDQGGLFFQVTPAKTGSSRAKFRVKLTGDIAQEFDPEGDVTLSFSNADLPDAKGIVKLEAGRYRLGHKRGLLTAPRVFPYKAAAKLAGGGKDKFTMLLGFAGDGSLPGTAPTVVVYFGDAFEARIASASFVQKGSTFTFKGKAPGVTKVVLNYLKETITVAANGADLGAFAEGPVPLYLGLSLGADGRAVRVRAVRSGKGLKY